MLPDRNSKITMVVLQVLFNGTVVAPRNSSLQRLATTNISRANMHLEGELPAYLVYTCLILMKSE